ncbi:MAG: tRNA (adenosine(37)-N6)-threonylcarbamoyltransferase complex dimerization subunit type 1 TsaB [Brevinematia bacterium]|mgnify:CR=1 FL=1
MKILGLDTSSINNFAIGFSDDNRTMELNFSNFENTDEYLTYSINSIAEIYNIKLSEVDYFAAGVGPGSFTGLRIGLSIIKTLAWASKKKVVPVSSLELLVASFETKTDGLIVPVLDARAGKIFTSIFENGERVSEDLDIFPEELSNFLKKDKVCFIGEGVNRYIEKLDKINITKDFYPEIRIKGNAIIKKAKEIIEKHPERIMDASSLEPEYLRKSEAELNLMK